MMRSLLSSAVRYGVMKKCWRKSPSDRPTFSELVPSLDKTLMAVAGYTELSMTLAPTTEEEEEGWYEQLGDYDDTVDSELCERVMV